MSEIENVPDRESRTGRINVQQGKDTLVRKRVGSQDKFYCTFLIKQQRITIEIT